MALQRKGTDEATPLNTRFVIEIDQHAANHGRPPCRCAAGPDMHCDLRQSRDDFIERATEQSERKHRTLQSAGCASQSRQTGPTAAATVGDRARQSAEPASVTFPALSAERNAIGTKHCHRIAGGLPAGGLHDP